MAISAILLHHPLHVLNSQSMLRFIQLCGLDAAMLHPDRIRFGVLYFHPDQVLLSGYSQSDPTCQTAVCYLAAGPDRIFQRIFKDGVDIRKCHKRKSENRIFVSNWICAESQQSCVWHRIDRRAGEGIKANR